MLEFLAVAFFLPFRPGDDRSQLGRNDTPPATGMLAGYYGVVDVRFVRRVDRSINQSTRRRVAPSGRAVDALGAVGCRLARPFGPVGSNVRILGESIDRSISRPIHREVAKESGGRSERGASSKPKGVAPFAPFAHRLQQRSFSSNSQPASMTIARKRAARLGLPSDL